MAGLELAEFFRRDGDNDDTHEPLVPLFRLSLGPLQPFRGSVYQLYSGSFGLHPSVTIKRTIKIERDRALTDTDVLYSMRLASSDAVQRLLACEASSSATYLVFESYETNVQKLISSGRLDRYIVHPRKQILHGLCRAVSYLHEQEIYHRDIAPRHVGIHNCNGEFCLLANFLLVLTNILLGRLLASRSDRPEVLPQPASPWQRGAAHHADATGVVLSSTRRGFAQGRPVRRPAYHILCRYGSSAL